MIVTSMDSKGIPHPDIKDLETWSLLEVYGYPLTQGGFLGITSKDYERCPYESCKDRVIL